MAEASAVALVRRTWSDLGRDPSELDRLDPLPDAPLPARLDVSGLAVGAVAAASLAAVVASDGDHAPRAIGAGGAGRAPSRVRLDGDRIASAFTSERTVQVDGRAPDVWAPLSGFWRTADGWVRTHGNYPHHAAVLRDVLGLAADAGRDDVAAAVAATAAAGLAARVTRAGGLCVVVAPEDPATDASLRARPLVDLGTADGDPVPRSNRRRPEPGAPLAGLRVLDLTRVIAGPVATRTLALLGADVLRLDPPALPEPEWQHLDTGAGKRSALLDVASASGRRRFDELAAGADVVVLGYRPSALARLGLAPEALTARHPHLVVAALAAWGFDGDAADRRGFDSLVQAASGIAVVEGTDGSPGALPAQALDHATGYLLAAAVTSMTTGGGAPGRIARVSLRRTAAELLGMPRTAEPTPGSALDDDARSAASRILRTGGHEVRTPAPAIAFDAPLEWRAGPRPWGRDAAAWAD
ncbi:CoA transferase [Agromyces sp. MMS24-K17]|uniref:CoA transferase n=1 Tax=Agromyces sp. MMS24-K17 TaxID=3372850 RepID=UPI00375526B0